MAVPELDAVEQGGHAVDAVLVAGEEDVVGQLAWSEADVVLPVAGGDRDPGIHGRQRLAPSWSTLVWRAAVIEDRGLIRAASSRSAHVSAEFGPRLRPDRRLEGPIGAAGGRVRAPAERLERGPRSSS